MVLRALHLYWFGSRRICMECSKLRVADLMEFYRVRCNFCQGIHIPRRERYYEQHGLLQHAERCPALTKKQRRAVRSIGCCQCLFTAGLLP